MRLRHPGARRAATYSTDLLRGRDHGSNKSAHNASAGRPLDDQGQRAASGFSGGNRTAEWQTGVVCFGWGLSLFRWGAPTSRECDGDGRFGAAFSSSRGTLAGRGHRAPCPRMHVGVSGWWWVSEARSRPVPPVAWLTVSLYAPARAR